MRLYSIKKYLRFKRVVGLLVAFVLISTALKMRGLFKKEPEDDYSPMTIKKFEVFRYTSGSFRVGSFLKTKSPGNTSHCTFRLGDSESFNYTDSDVSYSPELGNKGPYRILYGVVKGSQFNTSETDTVTYATHVTLPYLLHLAEIVSRWAGPVSIACFLPGTDAILALKILEKMCYCMKEMEKVNVHFVYHKNHPPKQMSLKNFSIWLDLEEVSDGPWKMVAVNSSASFPPAKTNENKTSPGVSCYVPENILKASYKVKHELVYPVNVARNAARYGSRSKYILVSDIELLPSENLVPEFLNMIHRLKNKSRSLGDHYFTKKKHVFVIPVFEVAEDVPEIPHSKSELLDLYDQDRAVYFHRYVCVHCQRFPGIQRWLQKKVNPRLKVGIIQPLLVVKREFPFHRWEPIYIGTNEEPLYSELLTWEGQQDKMTQMHEMCLLEYRFVILNGAFLVHTPGIKRKKAKIAAPTAKNGSQMTNPAGAAAYAWRNSHMKRNAYLYRIITQDVMGRYRHNPRCRIH